MPETARRYPSFALVVMAASFALTAADSRAQPAVEFFPAHVANVQACPAPEFGPRPGSTLDGFRRRWYSKPLQAANEPALFTAPTSDKRRTVRFTWLRSFDAPVIVRVDVPASGRARLIAKRLSGKGGYEPGDVVEQLDRTLDEAASNQLRAQLDEAQLSSLDPFLCGPPSTDGAQWIIESVDEAGYHFADRKSPPSGAVRAIGLSLLRLTGWTLDPIY